MSPLQRAWQGVPSVTAKFLIILIPILLLTTLGFSAMFFVSKHAELRQTLAGRIDTVAESNAMALSASLGAMDEAATRNIIKAIAINPELRCVVVEDEVVGKRFLWPEGGCPKDGDLDMIDRVIQGNGQRLGMLSLSFTYAPADAQVRGEIVSTLSLLALVLIGTVFTALTAHRLTIGIPLKRLIASIRLADRDHERRFVDWDSADELGRVIRAYNAMMSRLNEEEAALRQSEERLSLAITATRSSVWDLDLRTGQYWWSPEFPSLLGYGPDELAMTTEAWESLVHPVDLPGVLRSVQRHVRGNAPTFSITYRARRKNGSWMWLEDRATAIRDAGGQAVRLTGTMSDATQRMQAAEDLARERNILQITLDNVDQGIVMVDPELRLVLSNRRAAELLNVPSEFLDSRPSYPEIVDMQHDRGAFIDAGDDPDLYYERLHECSEHAVAFKRRRNDGTVIEVRSNPLPSGGFVRTFTDITVEARSAEEIFSAMQALEQAYAELKETQASLVQAEKMASLALLVAGVAHEINTPVGIAYGCATHLSTRTRALVDSFEAGGLKKSDLTAYVATAGEATRLIQQNLTRAAELIQSFKRVAVDQTSQEQRRFELSTYLGEVVTSLGPQLRKSRHSLAVDCPDGIEVNGYPGALSQVITNLIINALTHAFDGDADGRMALTAMLAGDGEVELRFSDDGKGIPEEHLPRIFEPFFTTRRGAGGSGLGLHIVYNLVTQTLGGRIAVDSRLGGGTTFTMRIPRNAAGRNRPAEEPNAIEHRGSRYA